MNFPPHDLFDYARSVERRNKAIKKMEDSPIAGNWIAQAREFAVLYASKHGEVTSDDVLKYCPRPADIPPNATGAVFRTKQLRLVGYRQSSKVTSHARRIGIYEVAA